MDGRRRRRRRDTFERAMLLYTCMHAPDTISSISKNFRKQNHKNFYIRIRRRRRRRMLVTKFHLGPYSLSRDRYMRMARSSLKWSINSTLYYDNTTLFSRCISLKVTRQNIMAFLCTVPLRTFPTGHLARLCLTVLPWKYSLKWALHHGGHHDYAS